MKKWARILAALSVVALTAACGNEHHEQDKQGHAIRSDKPLSSGTGVAVFTAPGWKAGDKAAWEQAMRARGQYGMNDHSRSP